MHWPVRVRFSPRVAKVIRGYAWGISGSLRYRCASCHGLRLKPEALAVRVGPYRIHELTSSSVGESLRRIEQLMGVGAHVDTVGRRP